MSIESVVNQSLDLIGYKRHVGSVWDGTPAARVALNAFAEVRDEVLAVRPWLFARSFHTLVATGQLAFGMTAYTRPPNAIVVLDVYPIGFDPLDPEPARWLETYIDGERLIVSPFTDAGAASTDRVLDTADWPPDYTEAVIRTLAHRFQRLLPAVAAKEEKQ